LNYVAHAFFSRDDAAFMLGQLLGDHAVSTDLSGACHALRSGVSAHRALDEYTDEHAAFRRACALLEGACGRYAPVLMDVILDHALVRNWDLFAPHGLTFAAFEEGLYAGIERNVELLPGRMRPPAERLLRWRWLGMFATEQGTIEAMERLRSRASRPEWVASGMRCFREHREPLLGIACELLSDEGLDAFSAASFCVL
jgi:acyl carrier protein phosphodiesterase